MQRAEHHVTGFGCCQRQANGLQVAQLTHQNDIRILTQGAAQGVGEGVGMRPKLALGDQAVLGSVYELDRVLNGQDVSTFALIAVVDHGRQRC